MSEMVEKLALAIMTELCGLESKEDIDAAFIEGQFDLRAVVRAVLSALREPTEAMVLAGLNEADKHGAILGNGRTESIFQAMIDVALSDGDD